MCRSYWEWVYVNVLTARLRTNSVEEVPQSDPTPPPPSEENNNGTPYARVLVHGPIEIVDDHVSFESRVIPFPNYIL